MNEETIFDHEKLDVYQIESLFNDLRFSVCERSGQRTISVTTIGLLSRSRHRPRFQGYSDRGRARER